MWHLKKFEELKLEDLYKIMRIRQQIFMVEQKCYYVDADNIDQASYHLMMYDKENLMAYARIIPPGALYDEPSIGRVVTHSSVRGTGLGKILFQKSIDETEKLFGKRAIKIMAQSYLIKFYQSFGFEVTSDEFLEDGIAHNYMVRGITPTPLQKRGD